MFNSIFLFSKYTQTQKKHYGSDIIIHEVQLKSNRYTLAPGQCDQKVSGQMKWELIGNYHVTIKLHR